MDRIFRGMLYGLGGPPLAAPPRRTTAARASRYTDHPCRAGCRHHGADSADLTADDHPTLYSSTSDTEGFAESFMLYCTRDPNLSHRSFKYFHDLENRLRRDAASGYSTDADDE